MLIFDNNNKSILLDSIHTPIATEYIWVLDLTMMDYTLAPLLVLEEVISPTVELRIAGFDFVLPTNWNVLVVDSETMQLDVIEVADLAGKEFYALVYGPDESMIQMEVITVTNYHPNYINVGPSLNKHQMLCHPISPTSWINVAPSDSFNKYLKNKVAGDII